MNINTPQIPFAGRYTIQGKKDKVEALYDFILDENTKVGIPTDMVEYPSGLRMVLTNNDIFIKSKMTTQRKAFEHSNYHIKANDLIDNKNQLKNNIIFFSTEKGLYSKIYSTKLDDVTLYPYRTNGKPEKRLRVKSICDFQEEIPLAEAIKKIRAINYTKYKEGSQQATFWVRANENETPEVIKTIEENPKLNKLKTNKLIGAGAYTMVFDIGDQKVLKISSSPCFPKKLEPFDLPILDKGVDKERKIYWCIVPKALNETENRITPVELKELTETIKMNGYKTSLDFIGYDFAHQAVKWNGKIYLTDYDCVMNLDGSSRMFKIKKS